MVYKIKKYGEDVLREVATEVETIDDGILNLLDDMVETMYETKGVGLAAPQVGVSKRIFVCDQGDGVVRKIINPVIIPLTQETIEYEEGCLSVPGIYKKVQRINQIQINYINEKNENVQEIVEGFLAVIMQHEFDHLNGTLFVDKVSPVAKRMITNKLKNMKKETLKEREEI